MRRCTGRVVIVAPACRLGCGRDLPRLANDSASCCRSHRARAASVHPSSTVLAAPGASAAASCSPTMDPLEDARQCERCRDAGTGVDAVRRVIDRSEAIVLSVVMPVYNEVAGVERAIDHAVRHILDEVPGSELVVVDDCSTDGSGEIIQRLAAADRRIRLLRNEENRGHGPSIRWGMDEAQGAWIFQLDSDGQVEVSEFGLIWRNRHGSDLVLGVRARRRDPLHRLVLTRLTRAMVSVLARRRVADANVPFKLIRRELYEHLRPLVPSDVFAPSILIVLGALRSGAAVREMEVIHLPREHGTSTLNLRRLWSVVARCAWETLRFSRRPVAPYATSPRSLTAAR